MRTFETLLLLLLAALVSPLFASAEARQCRGPTAPGYLVCAQDCEKDFPFTEHTDATFARFRTTCIQGCGQVCDENTGRYQSCYMQCKELFKYRHSMRPQFADFQAMCIEGCRYVH